MTLLPSRNQIRNNVLFLLVTLSVAALASSVSFAGRSLGVRNSGLANGQTLSGPIAWQASVSGSADHVVFSIDGSARWTEYHPPFAYNGDGGMLDTRKLSDGAHTFRVTAYPNWNSRNSVTDTVTAT